MVSSSSSRSSFLRNLGFEIHSRVFFPSTGIILLFVGLSLIHLAHISALFETVEEFIAQNFGWFYILSINLYLGFAVFLLFSPYGSLRLGGPDAKPDFSYWGWYAMLFSAGMGIGLLFWSVAEPISHFHAPPYGQGKTIEAAQFAMSLTFLHWGLHTWAIYALVGLGLAFFYYNCRLPLSLRSVFHPLLGERIHGPIGDLIDVTAAVSTLFGVATSLGLGAQQINAGLAHVFGIANSSFIQLLIIAAITAVATMSVVLGLARGIQRLSQINIGLAGILLVIIFILGPTLFILEGLIQNVGHYLRDLLHLSTWTAAYRRTNWQHQWTIFYWGWWIAWSPFVGMFIARISRGRTVREFLASVMIVPTLLTVVWLTVFGNSALFFELFGQGGLSQVVKDDVSVALFVLLGQFPFSFWTSVLGILVVMIFFVTSSDSASFVIDMITAGGRTNPPVKQRVFWAITEGVVAGVLLVGGGLVALRMASMSTGLPFALILLLMCVSLWKGFGQEKNRRSSGGYSS